MKRLAALFATLVVACSPPEVPPQEPTTPAPTTAASPAPRKRTYELATPERWQRVAAEGYETFIDPDGEVKLHVFETSEGDLGKAIEAAVAAIGADRELKERQRASGSPGDRFQEQLVVTYGDDAGEKLVQGVALKHIDDASRVYVFVIAGPTKSVSKRGAELSRIISSLEVEGAEKLTVKPGDRVPFDEAKREALYAFVEKARERAGVPGVALAVVTPEGVFTRGFGVRELGKPAPIDADTQLMIGSITKSFSTLLLATLVDDGTLQWEQPAKEVYPAFRLGDRTEAVQMQHLFCACTGAPRQDMELLFHFSQTKPQAIFDGVARMKLTTAFNETFQYNNQLTAAGGYIAGLAAAPKTREPDRAYAQALRARVLDKIGMRDTVLEMPKVTARKNFSSPHGMALDGQTEVVPLSYEEFVTPVAPAGALWSTANDMAKYIALQLGRGKLPDGSRLVSEENLARTQTPQTQVSHETGYGMGWLIGKYRGLRAIEHSGGTMGFNSDLVFFPEIGVGMFIVANRSPAAMNGSVRERLIELLFELEPKIDDKHVKDVAELKRLVALELTKVTDAPVPADLIGVYDSELLGSITTTKKGEQIVIDAGEWSGRLQVYDPKELPNTLIVMEGPIRGTLLRIEERDGKKALVLKHSQTDYVFTKR